MSLVYMQCINSINSYYIPARVVRLGGSACPPTRAVIEGTASLHSTQGVGLELELLTCAVRHACCGLDM